MIKFKAIFLFFLTSLILPGALKANGPVQAKVREVGPETYTLDLHIQDGMGIYAVDANPEVALQLKWTGIKNLKHANITWPDSLVAQRRFDEDINTSPKYFGVARINIQLIPQNPAEPVFMKGKLEGYVCGVTCQPISLEIELPPKPVQLWTILLLALVAGLFLNIMPCVLPILSLKILPFIKNNLSESLERRHILFFILGSLTFFVAFAGTTSTMRHFGLAAGWGLHFQNPFFLCFFIWILVLFAGRFFGLFVLPSFSLKTTRQTGLLSSFTEGLLVAILATPCTAPFLGTAAGYALTQPFIISLTIFAAVWLGFSFPYLLLMVRPHILKRILPKPGPWLQKLEWFFGGVMSLSVLWFLWVLWMQSSLAQTVIVVLCLGIMGLSLRYFAAHRQKVLLASSLIILAPLLIDTPSDPNPILEQIEAYSLSAKKSGKTTLVTVTAAWCLTCQLNKRVIHDPKVQKLLEEKGVSLVIYDWTKSNNSIGEFIHFFKRDGIPFSVLFTKEHPDGVVLPEILSYAHLEKALKGV